MNGIEVKAELKKMSERLENLSGNEDIEKLTKEVEALKRKVELIESTEPLEEAANEIREREGCSRAEALEKARLLHPGLYEKYQSNNGSSRPIFKGLEKKKAVQDFELLVEGIRQGEKVPRHVAMERARRLHPGAYQAYQDA